MQEATVSQAPSRLRDIFALLVTICGPSDPLELWEKYKQFLSEDILMTARRQNLAMVVNFTPDMFNKALVLLEEKILAMVGKTLQQLGLPAPQRNSAERLGSDVLRETLYDIDDLQQHITANEPLLVADQRDVYNRIINMVARKTGGIVFLDAPGGTGKTFVINLLLAKIRHQSKISIAVASSGIASTLLAGGRTAHSAFKLPLNLAHSQSPVCNIRKGTGAAKVLQECVLIVWDECTMSHKLALQALDSTLQA